MPETITDINCTTGEVTTRPETPEEAAARAEIAADAAKQAATVTPAAQEHAEALAVVQQRSAEDPAYAALARLTLPAEIARTLPSTGG